MDTFADPDAASTVSDDAPRPRSRRFSAALDGRPRGRYPASRDSLTGLPDRAMFRRILGDNPDQYAPEELPLRGM